MKQRKAIGLYLAVSALSILLSVYAIVLNPVLSSDSILYLRTAEAFAASGMSGALELYSWPFLSILIALLNSITGLSFELSAYLLSTFFYLVICGAFICVIRELGGSSRTQWVAAFLVLTYPTLNDYRDYIIRDHGFWALLLCSLVFLLRFQSNSGFRNAIGWLLCATTAVAFRIEASALLCIAPLALLFGDTKPLRKKFESAGLLYALTFSLVLLLLFVVTGFTDSLSVSQVLADIRYIPAMLAEISQGILVSSDAINLALSNPYLADDIGFVYVSGLLMLLVFQIMHAFLPNNLILLIWGRGLAHKPFSSGGLNIIVCHLVVIFLYLVFAIITKQFTNDRFMVPLCLMLLLWLPFYADAIIEQFCQQKVRWSPVLLSLLLIYSLFDSLISTGTSKQHIADAVAWLNTNTGKESKLLTNNAHIAYFGPQKFDNCAYNLNPARAYFKKDCPGRNLLVIEMKEEDRDLAKRLKSLQRYKGFRVINRFSNERQDQIVILQTGE